MSPDEQPHRCGLPDAVADAEAMFGHSPPVESEPNKGPVGRLIVEARARRTQWGGNNSDTGVPLTIVIVAAALLVIWLY